MAKYFSIVPVEADQFKPSKEQLEKLKAKQSVSDENGVQVKSNDDDVFGIVHLSNGETKTVAVGDYLVKGEGGIVDVKSKEEFEAAYKAEEAKKK